MCDELIIFLKELGIIDSAFSDRNNDNTTTLYSGWIRKYSPSYQLSSLVALRATRDESWYSGEYFPIYPSSGGSIVTRDPNISPKGLQKSSQKFFINNLRHTLNIIFLGLLAKIRTLFSDMSLCFEPIAI